MKRFISLLLTLVLLCTYVYASPIYSYREDIPISSSITLTKVDEFHSGHNISYSYIKADLTDKNTSLTLLKSNEGIDVLDTVGNLALTEKDTVAAINADFFSVFSGKKGFSLGIEIKDGDLITSPINPSTMATVSYTDDEILMSYLDFHIMAVAPNWQYNEIRHLNKHTTYYGDILMYTSEFNGGMSPAPGGEVVEVVVEDGKIREFRRNMPPVQIPENGCVLVVSEGVNMFFANNFNVGDDIKFDYYLTPDILNSDAAFGAGAMLVSEGKVLTSFSHVVSGYNPRTAIGIDKSGSTLYMVAVNGRQTSSRGMTMSELANLMADLGCYNAVNLDGGGSTNMVASTVWYDALHTVNSPTENRKVINAVGLKYDAPVGDAYGIMLENETEAVFIGQNVKITSAVYDRNKRPVNADISWSAVNGSVKDGVFTAKKGGPATVNAVSGNAKASTEIFVVDEISGIDVPSHIRLEPGQSKELDISVFDDFGHYVPVSNIYPFKITSSDTSVAYIKGKTIYGKSDGNAIISIEKDGVKSNISVVVGSSSTPYFNEFESPQGYFKSYPTYVNGSFEMSENYANSGRQSGKLSYDFTDDNTDTKGAYFVLNDPVYLHNAENKISAHFYFENEFKHEMRAQFTDGNGKTFIASFGKDYTTEEWQKLSAKIPDTAVRPLRLDRVYALFVDGEEKDSGDVYIDDISFDTTIPSKYISAEQNVYFANNNLPVNNADFSVGAVYKDTNTMLSAITNNSVKKHLSSKKNTAVIGEIDAFSTKEDTHALYITLDTSGGGIRNSDASQWDKMVKSINNTKKKNIFILSDDTLFGGSDFEDKVIKDYLSSTDKNVFVVSGGNRNTYTNIKGVHYFTLGNSLEEEVSMTHIENYSALEFYFGTKTTFDWKKIY